jgi:hypothetical protein
MDPSVIHLVQDHRDAVIDNTNNLIESMFKWEKSDPKEDVYRKSAGLWGHRKYDKALLNTATWIRDLEAIEGIALRKNRRSAKKAAKRRADGTEKSSAEARMEEEDQVGNAWRRPTKRARMMLLANDLNKLLIDVEGLSDRVQQYDHVMGYIRNFTKDGYDDGDDVESALPVVRTFDQWMRGSTVDPRWLHNCHVFNAVKDLIQTLTEKRGSQVYGDEIPGGGTVGADLNTVSLLHDLENWQGGVVTQLRKSRLEWGLLPDPQKRRLPKHIAKMVDDYIDAVVADPSRHNAPATYTDTDLANLVVLGDDLDGELANEDAEPIVVVDERKLVGINVPTEPNLMFSRYSVSIAAKETKLKKLYQDSLSTDHLPTHGDTYASLLNKQRLSNFLDELHYLKGDKGKGCSLANGDIGYMSPMRRTKSLCLARPFKVDDPNDDNFGLVVTEQYSYQCHEMYLPFWCSRPMTELEHAFTKEIWKEAWSFSTLISRQTPPNWIQIVDYTAALHCNMGSHRDNNTKEGLERMQDGLPPHREDPKVYMGVPNSQVVGSNVYVLTMGNEPMEMIWSYPNPKFGPGQPTRKYIVQKVVSMELREGYLTIVDPVDDEAGCHGIRFRDLTLEKVIEKKGDDLITDLRYRRAAVIRTMENVQQYFVETSRIKLNAEMREAMERRKYPANITDGYPGRHAFNS